MAFGLAAISYLALTGYDGLALRHIGAKVPYRLTALGFVHELRDFLHAGLPAGHGRGGALLALWAGRALRTPGRWRASPWSRESLSGWGWASCSAIGFHFRRYAIRSRENQPPRRLGQQGDRLWPLFAVLIGYLVWVALHAPGGPQGVFLNFKLAGPDIDARPNGARRHRRRRGCRRALRSAAADAHIGYTSPSARSILSRRCSASPATRPAVSAFSRRRCSRASADRRRPVAGVAVAVSRHLLSDSVSPGARPARRQRSDAALAVLARSDGNLQPGGLGTHATTDAPRRRQSRMIVDECKGPPAVANSTRRSVRPFASKLVGAMPEPAIIVGADDRVGAANKPGARAFAGAADRRAARAGPPLARRHRRHPLGHRHRRSGDGAVERAGADRAPVRGLRRAARHRRGRWSSRRC